MGLIRARAKKQWASAASAALSVIELPFSVLWALGPGLIWRDNPVSQALGHPSGWLYDKYVEGDRKGWPQ